MTCRVSSTCGVVSAMFGAPIIEGGNATVETGPTTFDVAGEEEPATLEAVTTQDMLKVTSPGPSR